MPPQRTIPQSQKPLKTERTHEENQERYDQPHLFLHMNMTHCISVPTLPLHEEVTEVSKPEWSPRVEPQRFTSDALAAHYESPNKM